jgi:hypothetical protein
MDKDFLEKADLFIELGTKMKEFANKEWANKKENELTEQEKKEYNEFMGFYVNTLMKLNK